MIKMFYNRKFELASVKARAYVDLRDYEDLILATVKKIILDYLIKKEGIQAAKNRGVKFGRTPIPKPDNYEEIHVMWADGRISGRETARRLGISQFTFRNWTKNEKCC